MSGNVMVKTGRNASTFVPSPLPPSLDLTWELASSVAKAERAVGELAGIGATLPNPDLLIQPFVRREAVLSSRIEGTEASIGDLVLFEAGNAPAAATDVREVANYITALDYGFQRLGTLTLSLRFIREVHEKLMHGVRGAQRRPGEFRTVQNWIGAPGTPMSEATYVPPAVPEMLEALDAFEKYLHAGSTVPTLVRLALIHYQFEAIHPFLDGNGRVGRLLITFLLNDRLLYLSAFFERHRADYYRLLLGVSRRGAWFEWIDFFLRAVTEQANDAIARVRRILDLHADYRRRITSTRNSIGCSRRRQLRSAGWRSFSA
jgi:Fic family protein